MFSCGRNWKYGEGDYIGIKTRYRYKVALNIIASTDIWRESHSELIYRASSQGVHFDGACSLYKPFELGPKLPWSNSSPQSEHQNDVIFYRDTHG